VKSGERNAHALAFESQVAPASSLAAQGFQIRDGSAEPFLSTLEKADDRLLARLRDAADGKPRLILETLPRRPIREGRDDHRTDDIESNEDHRKVVPKGQ